MKIPYKIIATFVICYCLFDTNVIGQKTVNAVPNYFQKDTIYTFEISSHNNDEAIQKITERLGKPVSNSIGELVWEKISLPYIGKNLKIVLKDGAFIITNDRAEFVPFKDVASKEKLMNESSKNVLRKTEIFVFSNGKNAITSTVNQGRMLSFLEGILEK